MSQISVVDESYYKSIRKDSSELEGYAHCFGVYSMFLSPDGDFTSSDNLPKTWVYSFKVYQHWGKQTFSQTYN